MRKTESLKSAYRRASLLITRFGFSARAGLLTLLLCSLVGCNGGGRSVIECGGGAQFRCPAGMFCDLAAEGNECGGIDRKGLCRPMPQDCPPEEDKVCTCEKHDYRNECYANASGETVAYDGACLK